MRFFPVNEVAAAILPRARPSDEFAILFSQSWAVKPASMQQPRHADRRPVTESSGGIHPRPPRGQDA